MGINSNRIKGIDTSGSHILYRILITIHFERPLLLTDHDRFGPFRNRLLIRSTTKLMGLAWHDRSSRDAHTRQRKADLTLAFSPYIATVLTEGTSSSFDSISGGSAQTHPRMMKLLPRLGHRPAFGPPRFARSGPGNPAVFSSPIDNARPLLLHHLSYLLIDTIDSFSRELHEMKSEKQAEVLRMSLLKSLVWQLAG